MAQLPVGGKLEKAVNVSGRQRLQEQLLGKGVGGGLVSVWYQIQDKHYHEKTVMFFHCKSLFSEVKQLYRFKLIQIDFNDYLGGNQIKYIMLKPHLFYIVYNRCVKY